MSSDSTIVFLGLKYEFTYTDELCGLFESRKHPLQIYSSENKLNIHWYCSTDGQLIIIFLGNKIGIFGIEDSLMANIDANDLIFKINLQIDKLKEISDGMTIGLHVQYCEDL